MIRPVRTPNCDARTQRSAHRGLVLGICAAVALSASSARALPGDLATKYAVSDENPAAGIPTLEQRNADPIEFANFLQDLVSRAENAFREKDYGKAVKYYEALARTVPDRAISFSRLCASYAGLGQVAIAAANCQKAVTLDGARVVDHFRFVNLTLQKPELAPMDVQNVDLSLERLRAHAARVAAGLPIPEPAFREAGPAGSAVAPPAPSVTEEKKSKEQLKQEFLAKRAARLFTEIRERDGKEAEPAAHLPTEVEVLACKVAVRLRNAERLERCVAALQKFEVDSKLLLPFAWSEALVRKDRSRAARLLESARSAGFPESALAAMNAEQDKVFSGAFALPSTPRILALLGIALLAGCIYAGARIARSRRAPATVGASR